MSTEPKSAPPAPAGPALVEILAFQRRTIELVAGEVREIPEGWVAHTPSLPVVWSLNHVRVTRPVTYEQAIALAERHQRGAGYRQIYMEQEAGGERLGGTFQTEGWEVDVEVHMALTGAIAGRVRAGCGAPAERVVDARERESLALMERWLAEDPALHLTADGLRQLIEHNRLTWRARRARRLGIRDGRALVGITLLFSDGRIAQVEDVYVVPEARGRGYGRALVTRATEIARAEGHELTFIVADDNDWPKHLYASVGFEPVGRTWMFHRVLRPS